jgi:SNF2 family DNA or RNA helicase
MGLGKTIQTIALMASTMISAKSPSSSTSADNKTEEKEEKEVYEGHRITLIVTPLALIHQWVDEIVSKTEEGKLRILKHHGPNRTKDPAVFKDYDVIVTTYQVVASDMPSTDKKRRKKKKIAQQAVEDDFIDDEGVEDDEEKSTTSNNSSRNNSPFPAKFTPLKKDHGPLFQLKWYRVVLDEAQFIKNRVTKVSLSCASLSSVKRWCLTGTPIQNNVDELYSLLRFLKIQPLSDYSTFKKTISVPIMNGDTQIAMSRLKAVLMAVMLRRTKSVLSTADATKDTDEPMPSSTGGSDTPTTTTTGEETENSNGEENTLSKKLTLQLPSRTKQDVLLRFSDHEKALYDLLSRKTKDTIQSMVGNQSRYMNMLCLLLRLRQGKKAFHIGCYD